MKDAKRYKTVLGCFLLLAIGTLPLLFSNPAEYLMGLAYSLFISFGVVLLLF